MDGSHMRDKGIAGAGVVILVEDNPDDEALTLRALKKAKVANEIIVARDGAEAIDVIFGRCLGRALLPALVLLDLNLPKISGLEVLRRMQEDERARLVPVVILTSSTEHEDVLSGYQNGANGYVRKPVNFAEFADAVSALGMFWLLLNEPVPIPADRRIEN
jgi:two-component system, response regulator